MLLAQITNIPSAVSAITNAPPNTAADIAKVFSDFGVNVSLTSIGVVLLAISKLAQIAYKHWTTEGSALDKVVKVVGVVQDAPAAAPAKPTTL